MDINSNVPLPISPKSPRLYRHCAEKSCCDTHRNKLIVAAIGMLVGFLLCMGYLLWVVSARMSVQPKTQQLLYEQNLTDGDDISTTQTPAPSSVTSQTYRNEFTHTRRRSLYVGVLTLESYLNSRATACNDTWGQNDNIDKLEFYADIGDRTPHSTIGLVNIPDSSSVDAWHTEKAFAMLEHMCSEHGNQYDWYIRAVDDSYIHIDRLNSFLKRLDKTKKLLLGHPTLPIDDGSYKALNGRGFCQGGPGLVFSRPLLQSLCPNLPGCRKRLSDLPADVAIAKCTSETVGLECAFVPELQPYFVHSFEKNQFHLLDEFSRNSRAITFHPLKSPWMMRSLHEHVMKRKLSEAIVQLDKLQNSQLKIESVLDEEISDDLPDISALISRDHISQVSHESRKDKSHGQPDRKSHGTPDRKSHDTPDRKSHGTSDRKPHGTSDRKSHGTSDRKSHGTQDRKSHEHTVFLTKQGQGLDTEDCSPSYQLTEEEKQEIQDAERLARTSVQWGKYQSCGDVLSVYSSHVQDVRVMTVDMVCHQLNNASKFSLARTTMKRTLEEPYLKDHRTWKTSRHLIIVIEADLDDLDLVNFVLNLYHISARLDQKLVLSVIERESHGNTESHDRTEEHGDRMIKDLKQWYHSVGIDVYIHPIKHQSRPGSVVYSSVLSTLSRSYPDATVLFTSVNHEFDQTFLQRCGDLVRQGRQVYRPHPVSPTNEMSWTRSESTNQPLCIHIKDYLPEKSSNRKRRNRQRKGEEITPLRVNDALDVSLRVTS